MREREFKFEIVSDDAIDVIKSRIYDLEDNLILQPKAHCVKCVFQIKE